MTSKRLISALIATVLTEALCTGALAADATQYSPCPLIEYAYTQTAAVGTVRYISQDNSSPLFCTNYWGSWASQSKRECLTASMSMALSYIGVDATPAAILDYGGGNTKNNYSWGGSKYLAQSFADAFANYVGGDGRYSPPIIHLNSYSSGGHYVVVMGKVSGNVYQVADPFNDDLWNVTVNGNTATYNYYGVTKTDTLGTSMQYYLDNGGISSGQPPQDIGTKVVFTIGDRGYLCGTSEKVSDIAPYIVSGYTYLPLYCVCSELGALVAWDGQTKTVTLTKGDTVLLLTIGSSVMSVNGAPTPLVTAPEVRDGRTCLPISPITQAFGADIAWNAASRAVTITLV